MRPRTCYFLFLVPTLAIIGFVWIYPLIDAFYLSFQNVSIGASGITIAPAGFDNYVNAIESGPVQASFARTIYFTGVSVTLELLVGLGLALLMNDEFRGRGLARSLMLLPWALATISYAFMWRWIYNPDYGALNGILVQMGLISTYRNWLGEPFSALHAAIFADVWKTCPFMALILLAGLQTIPKELYDSAKVDGAAAFGRFRKITLPLLKPAILTALLIRAISAFQVFTIIYILTAGGPADSTAVIIFYVYRETFKYLHFGYGSALSYLVTVLFVGIAVLYVRFYKSRAL